jgi:response regulator RpfG family c-di-GMP phosphodiesterase
MKKQILLVANESDVLESFPVTLTLAGHQVKLAHAGLQAIKQARDTFPDLIVLDATLPDMEGSTVMEILHRLPSTCGIPTLLLKPRPHPLMPLSLQDEGIRAGATRPFNPGEMLLQVADTLALCRRLDLQQLDLEREMAQEAV